MYDMSLDCNNTQILEEYPNFLKSFEEYKNFVNSNENSKEEDLKEKLSIFLYKAFDYSSIGKGSIDLSIKDRNSEILSFFETKKINSAEMIKKDDFLKRSFFQAILYYFREIDSGNHVIKTIIISNFKNFFFFLANDFYNLFYSHNELRKIYEAYKNDGYNVNYFYDESKKVIKNIETKINYKFISINENNPSDIANLLSPYSLANKKTPPNRNELNQAFYSEFIYILGLKKNGKNLVYSEIEGTFLDLIKIYLEENYNFEDAMELLILWINRILFIKILESQLFAFNKNVFPKILTAEKIKDFSKLQGLFFYILNKKKKERRKDFLKEFSHMPYLNSSLFEINSKEKNFPICCLNAFEDIKIKPFKNTILKKPPFKMKILEYLFKFLDSYNFIEQEEEDPNKLISSSVLGLIFERINGYKEGSYFTPPAITMYITRKSLIPVLLKKCKENKINVNSFEELKNYCKNLNKTEDKIFVSKIIDSIKIIDPSVGSGHFLLSCMNEIIKIKSDLFLINYDDKEFLNLTTEIKYDDLVIRDRDGLKFEYSIKIKKGENFSLEHNIKHKIQKAIFKAKKTCIENNLYGVDINPISTQIARLRLWIELLKNSYFLDEKLEDIEVLPNLEFKIINANSLIRSKKDELSNISMENILNIKHKYFDESNVGEKNKLKENYLKEIKSFESWGSGIFNPFDLSKVSSYFHSVLMFEIEKFDLVIGNPPYIQLDKGLSELYKNEDYKVFENSTDIYCLFIEFALSILSKNSSLAFITSNKWMRAKYGAKLRKLLMEKQIDLIIDLGAGMFKSATVDTNIIIIRNCEKKSEALAFDLSKLALDEKVNKKDGFLTSKNSEEKSLLSSVENFIIANKEEIKIKKQIEEKGTPLKDWNDIKINRGPVTGLNEAFIIDQSKYNELIKKDPKSIELLKPMLRGRNIKKYTATWDGLYLIITFPALNIDIDNYPAIKEHLNSFKIKLENRGGENSNKKKNYKWFETQSTVAYFKDFKKEKIFYREIDNNFSAYHCNNKFYINNKIYLITGNKLKYLTALLNSKLLNNHLEKISNITGGKGQNFMEVFPVIHPSKVPENKLKRLEYLVDSIQKNIKENKSTVDYENEINSIVESLYGF